MRFTRHRFRLVTEVLICAFGLVLCFSSGSLFHRFVDGAAWLLIGGMLCFVPEFHLRSSRHWFTLGLGLLLVGAGFFFIVAAMWGFFGPRSHGLLPFYELIGIGPLLLTTGVLLGFDKKRTA